MMAVKKGKIVEGRSVRAGRRTFVAGDEQDLAATISAAQAKRLVKAGVLTGDWSGARGTVEDDERRAQEERVLRSPAGRAMARAANAAVASSSDKT
jgi:hypothetical protein